MKLITLIGSCATGKSTRTTRLVEALGNDYEPIIVEGEEQGRIYLKDRIAIIGKMGKNGKWNSMDGFSLNAWAQRLVFFKDLTTSKKFDTVITEGFFNMCTKAGSPESLHTVGFDEVHMMFFYYDNPQEFLERINLRNSDNLSKEPKTIEWANGCHAWRDNEGRIKKFFEYFSEHKHNIDTVERLDYNCDENLLVNILLK